MLFTLAPILILLALFFFLSTGPEPAVVRNAFGVFFLGWGALLIGLGGVRFARGRGVTMGTRDEQIAQRVRTYMYLGGGIVFGAVGLLVLLGVINLNVGSRQ